jgi:hypothetical protein
LHAKISTPPVSRSLGVRHLEMPATGENLARGQRRRSLKDRGSIALLAFGLGMLFCLLRRER